MNLLAALVSHLGMAFEFCKCSAAKCGSVFEIHPAQPQRWRGPRMIRCNLIGPL